MAHIIEFSIEGLAGRKEPYAQKLNRDVNIFFGLNGSGKTSLLKILHAALSGDASIIYDVPFQSAEVTVFSADYNLSIKRRIAKDKKEENLLLPIESTVADYELNRTWAMLSTQRFLQHGLEWTDHPKKKKNQDYRFVHRYLPTSRLWLVPVQGYQERDVEIGDPVSRMEKRLDYQFQQALERLWASYMSEVNRTVREAQESGLADILKEVLSTERHKLKGDSLDAETAFKRVETFLTRQDAKGTIGSEDGFKKRYSKNILLKNVVNHINEVELKIEQAMAPRNKLQSLIQRLFSGNKSVTFKDAGIEILTEDQSKIGVASLSSGEKHVLSILIETLQAGIGSLIIDEPEISMHVDWQKELIPAMRSINEKAQLILATHSPEIMSEIDDNKIFRL